MPWFVLIAACAAVVFYAYFGYPLLLLVLARVVGRPIPVATPPARWPRISITLPAYNAERTLRPVLDALVRVDYPRELRQVVVVSDGSTDGTDALVREYADAGIELLRIEGRLGKTEIENRAMTALTGEIIVNTDASVTLAPDAVKHLVAALGDPSVGVASGRDISVASVGAREHGAESTYVGYEMWVRALETRCAGIIGSSGCLYAIRAPLHARKLPGHLSRDFTSALTARLHGLRAVSVSEALCYVPRASSMRVEYRRKIRTMSRGIQTLFHHARLMDPFRHGLFAIQLLSHKLIRWLVPWALAVGAAALPFATWSAATADSPLAPVGYALCAGLVLGLGAAAIGWWWPEGRRAPKLATIAAFFVSGTIAGLVAWKRALADERAPVWEPTPRALAREA